MSVPSFRLATFNMENLDDGPKAHPPLEQRLDVLRPQLQRLHTDVLCLQEVNGQNGVGGSGGVRTLHALDTLLEGSMYADYERVCTVSVSRGGPRDKHNLVILSRFPILDHAQIRHHLVPAPLYRPVTAEPRANNPHPIDWDRPILHATLDIGGERPLHVINVHLRAPRAAFVEGRKHGSNKWDSVTGWAEGFYIAAMKRGGQALETRMLVDQVFDGDEHALIAVTGDVNADDTETPARTILGDEEDIGNGLLRPRILTALERSLAQDRRYSVIHGGRRIMLDHVFASQALTGFSRGVEVHNEMLSDELTTPAMVHNAPESFHAPLVAAFGSD